MIGQRPAAGCSCTSCIQAHTHFGRVRPYRCPDCAACQDLEGLPTAAGAELVHGTVNDDDRH